MLEDGAAADAGDDARDAGDVAREEDGRGTCGGFAARIIGGGMYCDPPGAMQPPGANGDIGSIW